MRHRWLREGRANDAIDRRAPTDAGLRATIRSTGRVASNRNVTEEFRVFLPPKSEVDRDENLSTVRTFLEDTGPGW